MYNDREKFPVNMTIDELEALAEFMRSHGIVSGYSTQKSEVVSDRLGNILRKVEEERDSHPRVEAQRTTTNVELARALFGKLGKSYLAKK